MTIKKIAIIAIIIVVIITVATIYGSSIRPTIEQATELIPIENAPFIIQYRNEGWIDRALFVENYVEQMEYIKVINYYDRHGFHEEIKYIPKDWVISISERK